MNGAEWTTDHDEHGNDRWKFGEYSLVYRLACECCPPEWVLILPDGEALKSFTQLEDAKADVERRAENDSPS